jgi:hypothetical protein
MLQCIKEKETLQKTSEKNTVWNLNRSKGLSAYVDIYVSRGKRVLTVGIMQTA